jgi:hypothetical protein
VLTSPPAGRGRYSRTIHLGVSRRCRCRLDIASFYAADRSPAIATGCFSPKERIVRDAKKRAESSRAFVQRGHTPADRHANNMPLHRMRSRFDRHTDALGQPNGVLSSCIRQQGYEFFAAEACENVIGSKLGSYQSAKCDEDFIADCVPELVIDALELIEVKYN